MRTIVIRFRPNRTLLLNQLNPHDRCTNGYNFAFCHKEFSDHSGKGTRQFNNGLRRFNIDEDLIYLDLVTDCARPRQDLSLSKSLADVWKFESCHHQASARSTASMSRSTSKMWS